MNMTALSIKISNYNNWSHQGPENESVLDLPTDHGQIARVHSDFLEKDSSQIQQVTVTLAIS